MTTATTLDTAPGTDPLVEELRRRRDIAIANARGVIGRPGVDEGATLFSNLYAARQCDEALQLLARLEEPTR